MFDDPEFACPVPLIKKPSGFGETRPPTLKEYFAATASAESICAAPLGSYHTMIPVYPQPAPGRTGFAAQMVPGYGGRRRVIFWLSQRGSADAMFAEDDFATRFFSVEAVRAVILLLYLHPDIASFRTKLFSVAELKGLRDWAETEFYDDGGPPPVFQETLECPFPFPPPPF